MSNIFDDDFEIFDDVDFENYINISKEILEHLTFIL